MQQAVGVPGTGTGNASLLYVVVDIVKIGQNNKIMICCY